MEIILIAILAVLIVFFLIYNRNHTYDQEVFTAPTTPPTGTPSVMGSTATAVTGIPSLIGLTATSGVVGALYNYINNDTKDYAAYLSFLVSAGVSNTTIQSQATYYGLKAYKKAGILTPNSIVHFLTT
jgi:hypothetical protein